MSEKDKSILAAGAGGRWVVFMPRMILASVAGFLFWSGVIAAVRQVLELIP